VAAVRGLIGRKDVIEGAVLADNDDDMLDRAEGAPVILIGAEVPLSG
jgi:hypothetical protein